MKLPIWIVSLLLFLHTVYAHIALTFPPARKYDLDFLDSFRTSGDCGMNRGSAVTEFEVGTQINVTWHLGYPHGGGYRIELIREGGEKQTLVPKGGQPTDWETAGKYAQNHVVQLPQQSCSQCSLRLLRQATEWGPKYQFRSCSDITLVAGGQVEAVCGKNGKLNAGGACECDRLATGDRCQYTTHCSTDEDCNGPKGQGRCELVSNAIFEERICFCNEGWFGDQCERKNEFSGEERSWQQDLFISQAIGGNRLHWRVEADQVEMIVEAPTLSWVGVGWRPADAAKSCQAFPSDAPAPRGKDFHPMDCTDVVVGMARGERGAVADYYTRDRSTPRRDAFWGGKDDLTSGSVWESNGKTFLRFKKRIRDDSADHPFQGKLHFVYATGQLDDFYKADQLKYHGRKAQRGIAVIDAPEQAAYSVDAFTILLVLVLVLLALLFIIQIIHNLSRQLGWTKMH